MCACVCTVRRSTTASDVTDEDASCSGRHTDMDDVPRVSIAESMDSTYNELTDEDSQ